MAERLKWAGASDRQSVLLITPGTARYRVRAEGENGIRITMIDGSYISLEPVMANAVVLQPRREDG